MDSNLGISWNGEWLPMELWFKVFQYYCVADPVPEHVDAIAILRSHPLLAEILDRFIPYLGGYVFARSIFEQMSSDMDGCYCTLAVYCSIFGDMIMGSRDPQYYNADKHARYYQLRYSRDPPHIAAWGMTQNESRSWRILSYYPDHIRIHVQRLVTESMTEINLLLPWGCFVRDSRSIPEMQFEFCIPKPPSEWIQGEFNYKIRELKECEDFRIDYDDLYIPPWRPR